VATVYVPPAGHGGIELTLFSLIYGVRSDGKFIGDPTVLPFSMANSWDAESICRMLLMHELACELARALTKFGIAIAANKPRIAHTIIISTNVNPT
jgi:hypothetical protein